MLLSCKKTLVAPNASWSIWYVTLPLNCEEIYFWLLSSNSNVPGILEGKMLIVFISFIPNTWHISIKIDEFKSVRKNTFHKHKTMDYKIKVTINFNYIY